MRGSMARAESGPEDIPIPRANVATLHQSAKLFLEPANVPDFRLHNQVDDCAGSHYSKAAAICVKRDVDFVKEGLQV